jgi:hypothetical protein
MSRLGLRYQAQRQVVAEYQTTIDENDSRPNVRRPFVIGLIGAVYAIFSGVIWAAYHEFGDRSLLHQRPPMTAGPASNPVPGDRAQETTAVLSQPGGPPAQAGTARPASLFAEAGPAESRQSVAERKSSVAELESVVGSPAVIDRLAMARDGTRPGVALDAPTLAARSGEGSETSLDVRAAASPVSAAAATANEAPEVGPDAPAAAHETLPPVVAAAPAAANGPLQAGGTASPAAANKVSKADTAATPSRLPALKPLHAIPVLVAEAMPAPLSTSQRSRRASATSYPARPSFKPFELVSAQRPRQLPAQEADQEPRRAASTPEILPEAIQALWTNLKILLAAAPPPQVRPAGGDGSDWARSGTRAGVASAGDAGHTTGSRSNRGGGGSASGPSSGDVGGGGGSASGSGSGAAGSGGKGDNGGGGKGGGGKGGGGKGRD